MKVTVAKIRIAALIILVAWNITGFAQETVMYVVKKGKVVFHSPVSGVDNVTFSKASSDSALIVHKNDRSPDDKILLKDIKQLSFSKENLSVETTGSSKIYAFNNVAKFLFESNTTGIDNPTVEPQPDVLVYLTSADDVTVKSSVNIKSLILFSIDGKILRNSTVEALHATSLPASTLPAGVYILRVETEQGTIVKKVVKFFNK